MIRKENGVGVLESRMSRLLCRKNVETVGRYDICYNKKWYTYATTFSLSSAKRKRKNRLFIGLNIIFIYAHARHQAGTGNSPAARKREYFAGG